MFTRPIYRRALRVVLPLLALLGVPAQGAITKVRVADITPGTETVTLVTNGDFEDFSSGSAANANGWGRFGQMFYDQPLFFGNGTARAEVTGTPAGYFQTVSLAPNTEYVVSAYVAHLGDATHLGTAELDLGDAPGEPNDGGGSISLTQADADANDGYFVSGTFNTATTGTNVTVRIFYQLKGSPTTGWPEQPVAAIWDNIAITEASVYSAPFLIPEPSSLVLLSGMGLLALGRRRRK